MNERKIQKSLTKICKNLYWQEYYETAPTASCKRYIELEFYYSDYLGKISGYDEFEKECDMLEEKFVKTDWEHLYKHCANNPKKAYYKMRLHQQINISCY